MLIFITILISFHTQDIVKRDTDISKMIANVSEFNIQELVERLVNFNTRHTLSDTTDDLTGIGAARNWIKSEFETYAKKSNGRMSVAFDTFITPKSRRIPQPTILKNVVATLKGTDLNDDRIILVSGHYDSRVSNSMNAEDFAPGANDDASGTAATMELARVMATYKFPMTIKFIAVAGEEQGLLGSTNLAKLAKRDSLNIIAMITNDIVGNSQSSETNVKNNNQVRVFSEGVPVAETERQARLRKSTGSENDGSARQFARYIKEIGERYVDQLNVKLIYRRDRYLRGGDHTPFSREGFTAVRITEMNENYNHQHQDVRKENGIKYGDLPEFVDFKYIQKITRMNLASIANLAKSPSAPDSVGIVVSRLTNSTTLKWKLPKQSYLDGVYILIRETTSSLWERKIYVGKVEEVTLPYSKDNYLFAVQSVSKTGNESLPVIPMPVR